jgi:glycosyltransferase involved in cell wall biosynthesis
MKKHVCMVAYTNYPTDARVRREAETLAALADYRVVVFVLKQEDSPRTYVLDGVEVRELDVCKYQGQSNIRYMISYLRFLLFAFFQLNRLLMRSSLDVVHIHNMPNFMIFCAILPLLAGKSVILDIHDTVVETYASKFNGNASANINKVIYSLLRMEESICCKLASKIICVNHVQCQTLLSRGIPEHKLVISMNVPDPRRFNKYKLIAAHNAAHHGFKLVYFGTITRRLGIDIAIQAVAKLKNVIPDLEFHILGDGEDKEGFMKLSDNLGIDGAVHFSRNFLPLEELAQYLECMDLAIIPNRKDTATELMLPVKMLESIALGIPVVVPKLRAIEYYFSDDVVSYFEPDNVDSLAQAIINAYQNRGMISQKAERARGFLDRYGWEHKKFDLINLYRSLVS